MAKVSDPCEAIAFSLSSAMLGIAAERELPIHTPADHAPPIARPTSSPAANMLHDFQRRMRAMCRIPVTEWFALLPIQQCSRLPGPNPARSASGLGLERVANLGQELLGGGGIGRRWGLGLFAEEDVH